MAGRNLFPELPIPRHYDPQKVAQVWRVPYQELSLSARHWAAEYAVPPAIDDRFKIALLGIDIQNTFCIPGYELFVAGQSGVAAVEDNQRLCEFIYRNLGRLTQIIATIDSHQAMQIFHPIFLVDENGNHPDPYTLVSNDDIREGRWKFNTTLTRDLQIQPAYIDRYLRHYTATLKQRGRYELTIWPYHAMIGGIGHALVSSIEEAIFFHTVARCSQVRFEVKGDNPLTEHYSAFDPEVSHGPDGAAIAPSSESVIKLLERFDILIIAGQAKSHCVAATIDDLLNNIYTQERMLAKKVYLLEDCTSPVVIPGVVDYTHDADAAFQRFAQAGMHSVRSSQPIESWPGVHSLY